MQVSGLCRQRHFPAVAQPFRILWAPWSSALFFFVIAIITSILSMAIIGSSIGAIVLALGIICGHLAAIGLGLRMRYLATIVSGLENRRTGSTNLSEDKVGSYEFSNI